MGTSREPVVVDVADHEVVAAQPGRSRASFLSAASWGRSVSGSDIPPDAEAEQDLVTRLCGRAISERPISGNQLAAEAGAYRHRLFGARAVVRAEANTCLRAARGSRRPRELDAMPNHACHPFPPSTRGWRLETWMCAPFACGRNPSLLPDRPTERKGGRNPYDFGTRQATRGERNDVGTRAKRPHRGGPDPAPRIPGPCSSGRQRDGTRDP